MDTKLVDMPAATTLTGAEVLYVVQNGEDKKLSANVLFANQSNVTVSGTSNLSGKQTLNAPGVINASTVLTTLSIGVSDGSLTIANSTINYSEKIVIMVASGGGKYTLSGPNLSSSIQFEKVGHTARLRWVDNTWHVESGTANVIYP